MTCVAAYKTMGGVWMGADSAGVSGYGLCVRKDRKVFRNGPMLFGFTSSFRMGQILRHSFIIPDRGRASVDRYMHTTFIDAVRDALASGGYRRKTNEEEHGGEFLVAYAGRIFHIQEDFQVAESRADFDACGCGAHVALGSMFCSKSSKVRGTPREIVTTALRAAEQYSAWVRGPFYVLYAKPEGS